MKGTDQQVYLSLKATQHGLEEGECCGMGTSGKNGGPLEVESGWNQVRLLGRGACASCIRGLSLNCRQL